MERNHHIYKHRYKQSKYNRKHTQQRNSNKRSHTKLEHSKCPVGWRWRWLTSLKNRRESRYPWDSPYYGGRKVAKFPLHEQRNLFAQSTPTQTESIYVSAVYNFSIFMPRVCDEPTSQPNQAVQLLLGLESQHLGRNHTSQ